MGVDDDSHTNMVMKKFLVEIHGLMGTKLQFFFFLFLVPVLLFLQDQLGHFIIAHIAKCPLLLLG